MPDKSEWWRQYYGTLIGATVTAVRIDDDQWATIVFKGKDGTEYKCEISRDEEGNGPGFMFGLPNPAPTAGA